VVDYEDVPQVAAALLRLLDAPKESWRAGFDQARRELTWERAARPLLDFCRQPRRAADRLALGDRLGNPFYVRELARLHGVVEGYERGRFIRFMRRAAALRRRMGG